LGNRRGSINTCAMLALYRAFELGKMAVVAPISPAIPRSPSFFPRCQENDSRSIELGNLAALAGVDPRSRRRKNSTIVNLPGGVTNRKPPSPLQQKTARTLQTESCGP
jgi:hypothetical protein